MKFLLAAVLTACAFHLRAENVATFTGRHFIIQVEKQCCARTTPCDNVRFYAVSITRAGTLELKGKEIKLHGEPGATGYQFFHGEYSYGLFPDRAASHYWHFTVISEGKLLAEDSGIMK